jgi:hypothetical protein
MRLAVHVAQIGRGKPLRKPRLRWIISKWIRKIIKGGIDWIDLA